MPTEIKLSFPATMTGLIAALEAVDHTGASLKLRADLVSRMRIIVEELFSNTIKYGYGQECDRPVRLSFGAEPLPTLIYEDEAEPFDPTLREREDDAAIMAEDRPEGRAGIAMVLGLSSTATYVPRPVGNCLLLTFAPPERE